MSGEQDIVQRLRGYEQVDRIDPPDYTVLADDWDRACVDAHKAADEIERLRNNLVRVKEFAMRWGQ